MKMKKSLIFPFLAGVILFLPVVALADLPGIFDTIELDLQTAGRAIVVVGWIITGILYLTSGGNPDRLSIAKKAVVACVIGTVLVVAMVYIRATLWGLGLSAEH